MFLSGDRLRAGWRILLFFLLFAALTLVGQGLARLVPADAGGWIGMGTSLAAAVLAGWILLVRVDVRRAGALGFAAGRGALGESGRGFLVGCALLVAAVLLLVATGSAQWVADTGDAAAYLSNLAETLVFFALAAAFEEAVFRGYPFQVLVQGIGVWPAVVASSVVFALAHGANPNLDAPALANLFLAGVLLAVAYLRTRSLWFATALHLGWNWTMATLLDLPVSGLEEFDTPFYSGRETGADWWTGGAFGPEGGVAATLALVAGIVWLARSRRLTPSPQMRALEPLVEPRLPAEWR